MDSLWLVPLPDRSSEGVGADDGGAEDGGAEDGGAVSLRPVSYTHLRAHET